MYSLFFTCHVYFEIGRNFAGAVIITLLNVNKNPTDATVCRYLFTAKLFYMFRVSQHPSSGVLKTVSAASGTGHTTCTATSLPIRPRWRGVAVQVV